MWGSDLVRSRMKLCTTHTADVNTYFEYNGTSSLWNRSSPSTRSSLISLPHSRGASGRYVPRKIAPGVIMQGKRQYVGVRMPTRFRRSQQDRPYARRPSRTGTFTAVLIPCSPDAQRKLTAPTQANLQLKFAGRLDLHEVRMCRLAHVCEDRRSALSHVFAPSSTLACTAHLTSLPPVPFAVV